MRRFAFALLATCCIGAATAAHAAPVTISFSGQISSVPFIDFTGLGFNVGDNYSASFSYDTAAIPNYQFGGIANYPLLGASFTDGSTTIDFTDLADSAIVIENDEGGDAVLMNAYATNGLRLDFNAYAPQNSVFSSTALPASIDFSAFTVMPSLFAGEGASFDLSVPEPASMLVLGAGLMGLGLVRRRS